ncbi:hypothetical protein WR25_15733 [Diploscapter pachys]|uniref:Ig-like domain-containing protein n=1 Tax=Diploscapter pachys TaxID=2018661 RepID=A0A2A2J3X7_9BILA|nr:hypothetical protein WR25_15733 [Diploscapter pachys]
MPGAPRFTQKPSIQQTSAGDLLMECNLESEPDPTITWQHSGNVLPPGGRVVQTLTPLGENLFKATLVIKPNANDGGAYKCTAKNQLGESNANINLNFAGAGGDENKSKNPTFVGKPRIMPKDGGALIVMECKVKSPTVPTAKWMKDGTPLTMGGLYHAIFSDLGDQTYLCQLEIRGPSASDAGQYRCNIKNDHGETNANLALNFEEPDPNERTEKRRRSPSASPRPPSRGSRPSSPKKSARSREGTPKKSTKNREGSPSKKVRSRTSTPMRDDEEGASPSKPSSRRSSKAEKMEVDSATTKRKSSTGLAPADAEEKKLRKRSPTPKAASPAPAAVDPTAKAPVVIESERMQSGKSGSSLTLEVKWSCHRSTRVEWYKDGSLISSSSSQYSQTFDGTYSRLNIRRLERSTTGSYKCHAKSEYGENNTTIQVSMEESERGT